MFIEFRKKLNKKGFTLIELLIVVAIIGILAAIAIPQFAAYRIRGYNSAAHSDAKNVVTGQEAYFVDNGSYMPVTLMSGPGNITSGGITLPGAKLSNYVYLEVAASATSTEGTFYTIAAGHKNGDKIYIMESEQGKWKYLTKVAGAAMGSTATTATTNEDIAGATDM